MSGWVRLAARLLLAGVWLVAGGTKVGDLQGSVRAVHAYDLLPYELSKVVGAALPFVEIAVGVLLVAGFATRVAATASAALLVVFIGGISAAWARGLNIDCGCFGGGGQLAAGESPSYFWEIARDVALLAVAVHLVWRPVSRLAVDNLFGTEEDDDGEDDPWEEDSSDGEHEEARPAGDGGWHSDAAGQGRGAAGQGGGPGR
ncbi:hypothetical protein Voc01_068560 [Virgisporangium ochraceum]|uniref:Methylamine utilisation protein MauE domain-containing protein n=1 Tax=Virgisporangium ochraceum TaxID=65505 RepID=A0A8J3ZXM0_9ACTN|nr:hypothetical protein Voc01_068560 [Virgisporangium ochraceum]